MSELSRILRFLAVGGLNTLFGYAVFAALIWAGLGAQPALALAFLAGVLWNFETHKRLVFGGEGRGRLMAYAAVYAAIYAGNAGALAGLMALGLPPLGAQALCLPAAAALSYLAIGRVLTGRFPWQTP